jgi:DNA-binding NarL/FixJ family response regulator
MYGVEKSSQGRNTGGTRDSSSSRRTLLFVTATDAVSEALIYAVEKEFPWIAVEQVSTVEGACAAFDFAVSLILVDALLLEQLEECSTEVFRFHPTASIAVMHDNRRAISPSEIFAAKSVRSVLPMDLKLDIWLSIVRLLLRGGEYFPSELFRALEEQETAKSGNHSARKTRSSSSPQTPKEGWEDLTEREVQILEMVSRGLQNKIIAAGLDLSEHTVKIHLHNIIRKLGAHNRTEAAAIFFDRIGRK